MRLRKLRYIVLTCVGHCQWGWIFSLFICTYTSHILVRRAVNSCYKGTHRTSIWCLYVYGKSVNFMVFCLVLQFCWDFNFYPDNKVSARQALTVCFTKINVHVEGHNCLPLVSCFVTSLFFQWPFLRKLYYFHCLTGAGEKILIENNIFNSRI